MDYGSVPITEPEPSMLPPPPPVADAPSDLHGAEISQSFHRRNRGVLVACVVYFLVSCGVCTKVLPVIDEDFSDVVYFTVVTLTTCGFGDVTPKTQAGRLFIIFYVFVGVILFSIVMGISSVSTMRFGVKNMAKARSRAAQRFLRTFGRVGEAERRARQGGGMPRPLSTFDGESDDEDEGGAGSSLGLPSLRSLRHSTLFRVFAAAAPFFVFTLVGALVVHLTNAEWSDEMNYTNSLYFTFTTGTTIGYGDIKPTDAAGKWFCVFYIPVSVFVIWRTVHNVSEVYIQSEVREVNAQILSTDMSLADLADMDETGDGRVTEVEFTKHMLTAMRKVDHETMDAIHAQFVNLDADGQGWLDATELKERARAASKAVVEQRKPVRVATVQ
eukprot:g3236.t1